MRYIYKDVKRRDENAKCKKIYIHGQENESKIIRSLTKA